MNISFLRRGSDNKEAPADPISMLKQDHKKVKDLFDEFEKAEDKRTQMRIAKTAINELKVHAAIEEEIFYPGVAGMVDDKDLMTEAMEEHHVAHVLIDELEQQNLDSEVFHAKFTVLAENVRHHIKEEEGQMMPKIDGDASQMQELGMRMAERKDELAANPDSIPMSPAAGARAKSSSKSRSSSRSTKTSSASTRSTTATRNASGGKGSRSSAASRKRAS
jgi:hemerythrin superfamily protein